MSAAVHVWDLLKELAIIFITSTIVSVQSLSCVRLFATPWIAAHQASLSITNSRSSPKLMFPGSSDSKASAYNVGDLGSIPGLGRSPEEGNATHSRIIAWKIPLQRSLVGYSPWGCKESDTTEDFTFFHMSTIVWPQVNSREGTQLQPSTENWIKDLLSVAPPIRTRPSPPQSVSPTGSFHQPLILLHQRADELKTTIPEN